MVDAFRELVIKGAMEEARKEVTGLRTGLNQSFKSASGLAWCWISFEAFTCAKYQKDFVGARINDFCDSFGADYTSEYDLMPDEFKRFVIGLKSYNVSDMRPNHLNDAPIKINDIKDLKEVLKVVYRVRNNLFHGGKNMQEINDMTIVLCASKVLYYILEKVLSKENII